MKRWLALALCGGATLGAPHRASADLGDRAGFPVFSPEINVPIGARLTLFGAEACDAPMRYCFEFPLLAFGFDVTRPSAPGAKSISLAFAQAPLIGLAGMSALFSRSPTLRVIGVALASLAGGMFHWAPGGEGNVHGPKGNSTTLSFVLKNEIAFHPFVAPMYLRVTPGAGLALIRLGRTPEGIASKTTCGAGGFASFAAENGGQRGWVPGVWLTCLFLGD